MQQRRLPLRLGRRLPPHLAGIGQHNLQPAAFLLQLLLFLPGGLPGRVRLQAFPFPLGAGLDQAPQRLGFFHPGQFVPAQCRVPPPSLGKLQLFAGLRFPATQLFQAAVPIEGLPQQHLLFFRLRQRPPVVPLPRLQAGAHFAVEGEKFLESFIQFVQRLLFLPCPLVRGAGQLTVDFGAGDALQQFGALAGARFEKGGEIPLREQGRTAELLEGEPEAMVDDFQHFGFGAPEHLARRQIGQGQALRLQTPLGPIARPAHLPAAAITPAVVAAKIDFGVSLGGAPAQDAAHVVATQQQFLRLAAATHRHRRTVGQPWHGIEQGQTEGVEEGALAGAGRSGDGEQTGRTENVAVQLNGEVAGQAGQVAAANGENPHPSSPASACSSKV